MNTISIVLNKQNRLSINGRLQYKFKNIQDTVDYLNGIEQSLVTFQFNIGNAPDDSKEARLYNTFMHRISRIVSLVTGAEAYEVENRIIIKDEQEYVMPHQFVVPVDINCGRD